MVLRARHRFNGVIYARASTHLGNSLVLFYPQGDPDSAPIPGSIKEIYSIGGKTSFAVCRYHKPALMDTDPFSQWPEFPAQIWSTKGDNQLLERVDVLWVHSHFAQLSISNENVVVLDLIQI